VDVRIGVTNTMREIDLDVDDSIDREELKDHIEKALTNSESVLLIADKRGREVMVPSSKVAYVEIGSASEGRTIGFSA
jgi:hypothetical protein